MVQVTLEVLRPLADRLEVAGQRGNVLLHQEIVEGTSLRQLLHAMAKGEYQALVTEAYDLEAQTLTHRVLLILNGASLSRRQGLDTLLVDGDCITFLPPFEGGSYGQFEAGAN